jgi:ParB family chromosome partitioning protein
LGRSFETADDAASPLEPEAPDPHGLEADPAAHATAPQSDLTYIPIDAVEPNPFQPRQAFDPAELALLVESIRQHGILQPLSVRRVGERYQLIAGERRYRAAAEAGLDQLPAKVVAAEDQQVFELAIVENLQRSDLNPIEKARAFREYLDRFGGTHDELAKRLGVDRSTVSNFVRLLDLAPEVQQAVIARQLSQGHARALLAIGDIQQQAEACRRAVSEGLSVRQVEAMVAESGDGSPRPPRKENPYRTSHVENLEAVLRERLATKVEIRLRAKERGQILIDFASNDDFDRIIEAVCGIAARDVAA